MPQPFGVDTQTSHLDLIAWPTFIVWNGDEGPAFAGRNFLGGDFLWTPAEATTALAAPQPDNPSFVVATTDKIAPMQGVSTTRQQVVGALGALYGKIDAAALCKRISASIGNKELTVNKSSNLVNVYLQVDSSVAFSADYWAGWADTVLNATCTVVDENGLKFSTLPYAPCIMCAFTRDVSGVLHPDPHVTAAIQAAQAQHRELHTRCWGFWADAADLYPELQRPGGVPDFTKFAPTTPPVWVWRFANTLLQADGTPIRATPLPISADASNTTGTPPQSGTDFMLDTGRWQPSIAGVVNRGFSFGYKIAAGTVAKIAVGKVPDASRSDSCDHVHGFTTAVKGGPMKVMGLYIRETAALSAFTPDLVNEVAQTRLRLYTVYEQTAGATLPTYYDPANHHGTTDGQMAFKYAAETLFQAPHAPILFAFDWSPDEATPDALSAADLARIKTYIADVHDAYTQYLTTHPNRPFRIGFYGSGVELLLAYQEGSASGFWQSPSACRGSNMPPNWPWPHATRWQAIPSSVVDPKIGGLAGEDIDYDWGDGADWSPIDQFNVELTQLELQQTPALLAAAQKVFGNLIVPPNPPKP